MQYSVISYLMLLPDIITKHIDKEMFLGYFLLGLMLMNCCPGVKDEPIKARPLQQERGSLLHSLLVESHTRVLSCD